MEEEIRGEVTFVEIEDLRFQISDRVIQED
jgi:hypothetical protein